MTVGTLRDQILYPDSKEDKNRKHVKDADLEDILKKVQLEYILEREKGWNSVQVNIYFLHVLARLCSEKIKRYCDGSDVLRIL